MTVRERMERSVQACQTAHGFRGNMMLCCETCFEAAILAHAEAVRKACEDAMCPYCRDGLPIQETWRYGGEEYELWLHLSKDRISAFPCQAAAIRAIPVT